MHPGGTLPIGITFAREFRIDGLLGEGGMGAVYVATQLATGKRRALKTMHRQLAARRELCQRFVLEAHVAARIESEHVVDVVGAGVDAQTGLPWIAMELLDGMTVADAATSGVLGRGDLVEQVLLQLGDAVAAAHVAGVVHRDLKPENLFLAKTAHYDVPFVLKVLDFGIAKIVDEGASRATQSVGTPLWMAPEQADAGATVTPATDVWSMGLLAFWLLTGRCYWRTTVGDREVSAVELLQQMLVAALPSASERAREMGVGHTLPAGFDAWFARAVARRPEHRFADGTQALAALRLVFGRGPSVALADTLGAAAWGPTIPGPAHHRTGAPVSRTRAPKANALSDRAAKAIGGAVAVLGLVALGVFAGAPRLRDHLASSAGHDGAVVAEATTNARGPAIKESTARTFASAPIELAWEDEPAVEHEVEVLRADGSPVASTHVPPGVSYAVWPWAGEPEPGSYRWRVRSKSDAWSESTFAFYPSVFDRVYRTKKLRVAMETTHHAPFVTYDPSQKRVVGFDVELADAIAKELGATVERRSTDWAGLFRSIETRDVDVVISAVSITPERAKRVEFSAPYVRTGIVMTTRTSERVAAPGTGKTLAVQRNTTAVQTAAKTFPKAKLRETDTLDAAFGALLRGDVDGVLADEVIARSRAEVNAGTLRVDGARLTKEPYGVVVPAGDETMRGHVDDALRTLEQNGTLPALRARYGIPAK